MAVTQNLIINHDKNLSPSDKSQLSLIRDILYTDATLEEAQLILAYCIARKIDPILKPIHLVPMDVKTDEINSQGKPVYKKKRVIMPGIPLYRIIAGRTNSYAGICEPIYGEDVTEKFDNNVTVTYPKWCLIVVKRIIDGSVYDFYAKEFWKENYAPKGKWDAAPNHVWSKRPYGQLAKCAEAQALRKAFPEHIGGEYTYEEMDGKIFLQDEQVESKKLVRTPSNIVNVTPVQVAKEFDLNLINNASDVESLKIIYAKAIKTFYGDQEKIKQLNRLTNQRKKDLEMVKEFNDEIIDAETGESTHATI